MHQKPRTVVKTKGQAVTLAFLTGFFTWLYTYKQDRRKFWLALCLSAVTLGLFLPITWIWAIINRLRSKQEFYSKSSEEFTKAKRYSIWLICVVIILFIIGYIGAVIKYNVEQHNIEVRNQQRLAADPIASQSLYNALNKERSANGATSLASVSNLDTAAQQKCSDMSSGNYLDYKNPTTGKDANSYITDNQGDLYFKTYVVSIGAGSNQQTATDLIAEMAKNQSTNLNNPTYNSVGWSTCPGQNGLTNVVAMLADKEDKPQPASPAVNNYYSAPSTYRAPIYTPPRSIHCSSYELFNSVETNCY